jgi:hypothetical protein
LDQQCVSGIVQGKTQKQIHEGVSGVRPMLGDVLPTNERV